MTEDDELELDRLKKVSTLTLSDKLPDEPKELILEKKVSDVIQQIVEVEAINPALETTTTLSLVEPSKRGKPLTPISLKEVERYARLGFTDRGIAEGVGLSYATFEARKAGRAEYSAEEGEAITKAVGSGRTEWRLKLHKLLEERLTNGNDKIGALLIFSLKQEHGVGFSDQTHKVVEHTGNVDHTIKTPAQQAFEAKIVPKLIPVEVKATATDVKPVRRKMAHKGQ